MRLFFVFTVIFIELIPLHGHKFTNEEIVYIVNSHNEARNSVNAANMLKLLMWANASEIGCHYIKKDCDGGDSFVCYYKNGAQGKLQKPYIEGEKCTKCPSGTKCEVDKQIEDIALCAFVTKKELTKSKMNRKKSN